MLVGLVPFGLTQCYAGTLRESRADCAAHEGQYAGHGRELYLQCAAHLRHRAVPRMGVAGAAIATVLSRFCGAGYRGGGCHRSSDRYPFLRGIYSSFAIPGALVQDILIRSTPLLANELMWGAGQAVLLQCYSARGIQAVAALNICNTIAQIFNEVFLSLGQRHGYRCRAGAGRRPADRGAPHGLGA